MPGLTRGASFRRPEAASGEIRADVGGASPAAPATARSCGPRANPWRARPAAAPSATKAGTSTGSPQSERQRRPMPRGRQRQPQKGDDPPHASRAQQHDQMRGVVASSASSAPAQRDDRAHTQRARSGAAQSAETGPLPGPDGEHERRMPARPKAAAARTDPSNSSAAQDAAAVRIRVLSMRPKHPLSPRPAPKSCRSGARAAHRTRRPRRSCAAENSGHSAVA